MKAIDSELAGMQRAAKLGPEDEPSLLSCLALFLVGLALIALASALQSATGNQNAGAGRGIFIGILVAGRALLAMWSVAVHRLRRTRRQSPPESRPR